MSLISAWAQSSRQPVTLSLNLRGRLAYSRLPVKKSEIAWAAGGGSSTSSASRARARAADHVAGRGATGLHGGHAHRLQPGPDLGDGADPDPVELDVLAGGD